MTVLQAYKRAIESDNREQQLADHLYEGVKQLIQEGTDAARVQIILYDLFQTADAEGNDIERDAIAEVMDCLAGWTSKRATLPAS